MDEHAAELARAIGSRVRDERKRHDWTLEHLAAAAGVSRRMLVSVEQGTVNPSVGSLLRIASALGVGLPALVEPPAESASQVTRSGDGATLWLGEHGGRGVLLAGTAPPDVIELWDWTFEPGDSRASEPHTDGTREVLQVQRGTLTVTVDGETHQLTEGDSLSFRGDVDHEYANNHDGTLHFLLSVFEPAMGRAHHLQNGAHA
ncbi:helix-turn-helix domain-containing protein [Leucobacter sp. HY1910]